MRSRVGKDYRTRLDEDGNPVYTEYLNLQGLGLSSGTALNGTAWDGVLFENFETMDVRLFRADRREEVGATVEAAGRLAFNTRQSAAVLLSQKMIGAKQFEEG